MNSVKVQAKVSATPKVNYKNLSTLTEQTDRHDIDINKLKGDVSTAQEDIATLQEDVDTIDQQVDTIEGDVQNHSTRLNTAETKISTLETNVNNLDAWLDDVAGDVSDHTTRLATAETHIDSLISGVNNIEGKIPSEASSSNKLADKNFVNSSVATNTATFQGTYRLHDDLGVLVVQSDPDAPIEYDKNATATALAQQISGADNNDYCFVVVPVSNTAGADTAYTDRYKYNGVAWDYEYTLNSSGFTTEQWSAINSGITQTLVTQIIDAPFEPGIGSNSAQLKGGNVAIGDNSVAEGRGYTHTPEDVMVCRSATSNFFEYISYTTEPTVGELYIDVDNTLIVKVESVQTHIGFNFSISSGHLNIDVKYTLLLLKGAIGDYSHVEGNQTEARGVSSHAEGNVTVASNLASHAEGNQTEASGQFSHSEGSDTIASEHASHAEGLETEASGVQSHAEGYKTKASAYHAHAEGDSTEATGNNSHSEGRETIASGNKSHAGGYHAFSRGENSFAHGEEVNAFGKNSIAFGLGTRADVEASAAFGKYNTRDGEILFSVGVGTSDGTRDNAIEVKTNGKVKISKDLLLTGLNWPSDSSVQSLLNGMITTDTQHGDKINALENSLADTNSWIDDVATDVSAHETQLTAIEGKIPSAATSSNQLADKNFVNSSIATATATFRGSYRLFDDLGVTVTGDTYDKTTCISYLASTISSADNNDYCFVVVPTENTAGAATQYIDRYKYNGTAWSYEYTLNNSGFTAEQWSAINSGIAFEKGTGANSVKLKADSNTASGEGAVTFGRNRSTAVGIRSFSHGDSTFAEGNYSHAEGQRTQASGESSHAEGFNTVASASYSHAEGSGTEAAKVGAHAEGNVTSAYGGFAHAEGFASKAIGDESHAEGDRTEARGTGAHAEGANTEAKGTNSHAEGEQTKAEAQAAHAEGYKTTTNNIWSHAEGSESVTRGTYSHSEGKKTTTFGSGSHAEGAGSLQSLGSVAVVNSATVFTLTGAAQVYKGDVVCNQDVTKKAVVTEDSSNGIIHVDNHTFTVATGIHVLRGFAAGECAHSEGKDTKASGDYSHAEGNMTYTQGQYSHAEGIQTETTNTAEHASGKYNKSNQGTIHSVGVGTSTDDRKNAFEIDESGNVYIKNVGGYDGTNPSASTSLQTEYAANKGKIDLMFPSAPYVDGGNYLFEYNITTADDRYVYAYINGNSLFQYLNSNNINSINVVFKGTTYNLPIGFITEQGNNKGIYIGDKIKTVSGDTQDGSSRIYPLSFYLDINSAGVNNSGIAIKDGEGAASTDYFVGVGEYNELIHKLDSKYFDAVKTADLAGYGTDVAPNGELHFGDEFDLGTSNGQANSVILKTPFTSSEKTKLNDLPTNATLETRLQTVEGSAVFEAGTGNNSAKTKNSRDYVIASGMGSFTNGRGSSGSTIEASGSYSHAEGYGTKASGDYSHAEGANSKAIGAGSHAEGYYTIANKEYSHAEGGNTKTTNFYEHASGKYNNSLNNVTLFSIGCGTSESVRKNAFEVDTSGNVYIKGINDYDGTNSSADVSIQNFYNNIILDGYTIDDTISIPYHGTVTVKKDNQPVSGADLYTTLKGYWDKGKVPVLKILLSSATASYNLPMYYQPIGEMASHLVLSNDVVIGLRISNTGVANLVLNSVTNLFT